VFRNKIFLSLILVLTLAGLSVGIYYAFSYNVQIVMAEETKQVRTFASTVAEVLEEEGIVLTPDDEVNPALTTLLKDGTVIKIAKAFPVTLIIGEEKKEVMTPSVTVSEFLTRQNLTLGKDDQISPSLTSYLKEGEEVRITRIRKEKVIEKEEIPFKVVYQNNPNLASGTRKVVQKGETGIKELEIEIVYENNREINRAVLNEKIAKEPKNEIIARGTMMVASRGGKSFEYEKVLNVEATAYSFSAGHITATGAPVARGVVAVDPKVIPLGTRLYVEGYGYGHALDVGGSIKGNRIDVFFPREREALNWGRRWVKVYVLK
jgi:uncharacterized protein YabE (DUF348 family)